MADEILVNEFKSKLFSLGVENFILQINKWHEQSEVNEFESLVGDLDCMTSRTLTANGIFACPFLANDYRGRCGSDFSNYSKTVRLETPFCATCIKNKEKMFSIDL